MLYEPNLKECKATKKFQLGSKLEGFLVQDIKSEGSIKYKLMFIVFDKQEPILYYCQEYNQMIEQCFTGIFDEKGHHTLGGVAKNLDAMSFLANALDYTCDRFKIKHDLIKEIS